MSQLFNVDRVSVVMFKPGADLAFVVAEHEKSLVDNIVIRISDYPELQAMVKSREPLLIPDVLGDSLLRGCAPRSTTPGAATCRGSLPASPQTRSGRRSVSAGRERMDRVEDHLLNMGDSSPRSLPSRSAARSSTTPS